MARHCTQLLEVEASAAAPRLDAVLVDSRLQFPANATDPGEVANISVAVVSLHDDPATDQCMAWLAASPRGVRLRRHLLSGCDCVAQFTELTRARNADFAGSVILLDGDTHRADDAQAVVDAVQRRDDAVGMLAVVSEQPEVWAGLQGITGFVRAEPGQAAQVASSLGLAMATIAAPLLLTCLDIFDMEPALGPADQPSRVVDALWIDHRETLLFISVNGEETFRRSANVIAFIFANSYAPVRGAMSALRNLGGDQQSLDYQVAGEFLVGAETGRGAQPVRVTLLCAS